MSLFLLLCLAHMHLLAVDHLCSHLFCGLTLLTGLKVCDKRFVVLKEHAIQPKHS